MRISTNTIFDQSLSAILNQQSNVARTQQQVSSGERFSTPSQDPAGAVQALNIEREKGLAEQYQKNAERATTRLEIEDSNLESAVDILQRVRELAVQGLNDTNTADDRRAIASEINQLNEQLFSIANTRDSNGDYLFSGYANGSQPYETILGEYQGDEGQRNFKVGAGVFVETNDAGNEIFEAPLITTDINSTLGGTSTAEIEIVSASNTDATFDELTFTYDAGQYTVEDESGNSATFDYEAGMRVDLGELNSNLPGLELELTGTPVNNDEFEISRGVTDNSQPLFQTIRSFAEGLESNSVGPNDSPNNGDFLTNISSVMDNIVDKRADIGGRLNAIDEASAINDELAFNLEKNLSDIKDLDYAEAISRLTRELTGLEAAQQTFGRVQSLSLFNFL